MSEEALLNPEIEPQVEETAPGNDWIQSEQEEEVEEPAAEEQEAPKDNEEDDDEDEEDYNDEPDYNDGEENVYSIKSHKLGESESGSKPKEVTQKKNVRKSKSKRPDVNDIFGRDHAAGQPTYAEPSYSDATEEQEYRERQAAIDKYSDEDPSSRKRRLLEEKMDQAIKVKTVRRKKDEDDIERMQDDKIDYLKDQMIKAANLDVEKNSQGQIATEKLKLLTQVSGILSRADLAISILDNNLLEAVRLWLEPLPDASMPAYQIQKSLIFSLETLPIKTDHLVASGLGKVLVFYQRSKRTEPSLKKIVDRLIGDWTRPILNKSDSYKDRSIQFNDYNKSKFSNKLASARLNRPKEAKTLYEQNAARRNRAAIPSARTAAYKIAPRVDASLIKRQQTRNLGNSDERFKRLNSTLTSMSVKKKTVRKGGPSIEGRNLAL